MPEGFQKGPMIPKDDSLPVLFFQTGLKRENLFAETVPQINIRHREIISELRQIKPNLDRNNTFHQTEKLNYILNLVSFINIQ